MMFLVLPLVCQSSLSEEYALAIMILPGCVLFVVCGVVGFPVGFFWALCTLSTSAAPLGVSLFLQKEYEGQGLTDALDTSDGLPLAGVWAFQIFDAIWMACLAWYLDQIIPAPGSSATTKRCAPSTPGYKLQHL